MQIRTSTDRTIQGSDRLAELVKAAVEQALGRFRAQITRVEVHLSDENSARGGADDKRCTMEARLGGRPPTAVTHRAATLARALGGAAAKLAGSLEHTLGRLRDR